MPCVPTFRKNIKTLICSTQICPKMNFEVGISKIQVQIRNLDLQDTMSVNFQLKRTTLTFLVQICPKRKLGFEIQKTNVGIRISIFEIPFVPILRQNRQFWLYGPKFVQKWIWGRNFKNLSLVRNQHPWDTMCTNFQTNWPKNGFWGQNFKNLSLDAESTSPIYHEC